MWRSAAARACCLRARASDCFAARKWASRARMAAANPRCWSWCAARCTRTPASLKCLAISSPRMSRRRSRRASSPPSSSCSTGTASCAPSRRSCSGPRSRTTARSSARCTRVTRKSEGTMRARAAQLMHGLGFAPDEDDRPIRAFSGGWRVRINVARALMCRSDLLLLDEPTNHLDIDAILWLENWLRAYPGTLLLIAHDREFLDRVCNRIVNIEHQRVRAYRGNYSAFETQRAAELAEQSALYARQQREIRHMESFVERFRAQASKARQAQSRLKALERMQR